MATKFLDKEYGVNTSTAIADDATGRAKVQNLPDAAGITYDKVDGFIKYNDAGNIRVVVNTDEVQTLTNKVISGGTQTVNDTVVEYASDGAIAATSHTAVLTKGSAGAYTLGTPASNGIRITIVAGTSFAHVVTGTNLFWAGETGGPFNKVTTAAFIGSAATLVSWNSLWLVVSDQIATIGD